MVTCTMLWKQLYSDLPPKSYFNLFKAVDGSLPGDLAERGADARRPCNHKPSAMI